MRYGLTETLEELTAYVLGKSTVPYVPYNESGDWEMALPRYENQTTRLGQETSGCTVHGSQNQLETLYRFLYNEEPNYSERFTYLNVPIDPARGTDPQNTYEAIRKHGLVDERDLPMTDTLAEYLDSSDITGSMRAKGQYWLKRHDYQHEWLWKNASNRPANYIDILKDALQTCPIAVSVSAWHEENGVYVSYGDVNNHFCLLYKIDAEGYPWVFDSYDHSKKKLSKDHNIRRAKRIWLNKRTKSAMQKHVRLLQAVVNFLMNTKSFRTVVRDHLGKDASPQGLADAEVACAESVTYLLKQVYKETPIILGTASLYEWFAKQKTWKLVTDPEEDDIIISPTGYGNGSVQGHTGIVMRDGLIASNNSFGRYKGKFTENFTINAWNRRYKVQGGLPVYFFRRV